MYFITNLQVEDDNSVKVEYGRSGGSDGAQSDSSEEGSLVLTSSDLKIQQQVAFDSEVKHSSKKDQTYFICYITTF